MIAFAIAAMVVIIAGCDPLRGRLWAVALGIGCVFLAVGVLG